MYMCVWSISLSFLWSPDYLNGSPSHKTTCPTNSDTGGDVTQTGGGGGGGGSNSGGGGGGISGEASLWLCEMNPYESMFLVTASW